MNQTRLELVAAPAAAPATAVERIGFDIGWDHAHHGLVPPAELLLEGTPLGQGWRAGRAVFGSRTLTAQRQTRLWLALRIEAWRRGIAFETQQVTPHYLGQIQAERCPVLRVALGGAAGDATAAVVERINPGAGYAAGNLVTLSRRAAAARAGVDPLTALRRAHGAASGADDIGAAAWSRIAALAAFATALDFGLAARLPLALLPPDRVRLLNAPQGLQALLTLQFATPGWAARMRAIADMLPEHTLRGDFNLFVGALAPRAIEAASAPAGVRQGLEDAWLNERLQRRWQHFVLSLGAAATAELLERCAARGLAGVRLISHAEEQATEGWGLNPDGRALRSVARPQGRRGIRNAGSPPSPRP
ncbi:MAG: hypothetical protein KGL18_07850 [Burkholderiales bacterium]|nr:hypothetical protein [Burkholderiales bacterium]MDE1926652.1 hypothetical protein [Burkholderiales bacterium]MDE2159543.1 hypothetical protein [Burkholderiales bacterium]MDE2502873.1 hypothetical protein [Burkholderiales bacterium]